MKIALRIASVLAAVAAGVSAPLQDAVTLRLKYAVGDELRYRMVQEQLMESEFTGEMVSEFAMVMRQKVSSVAEDGAATLNVRYEAIRMSMEGMAAMSYDSTRTGDEAKKNSAEFARMFEPMLGTELTMVMEPNGRVRSVQGMQELLDGLGAGGEMFTEMFSDEKLARMLEVSTFPAEPVGVGGEWKRSTEMEIPMLGKMVMAFDNQLDKFETREERRLAHIAIDGEVSIVSDPEQQKLFTMTVESTELDGYVLFDVERGRVQEMSMAMELEFAIGAPDTEDDPTKFSMAMSSVQKMKLIALDAPFFE